METLQEKVLILFIDKFLLALVAAGFGYFFSKAIENYKNTISLDSELLKVRANLGKDLVNNLSDVESAYLGVAMHSNADTNQIYGAELRAYIPLLRQVHLVFSTDAIKAADQFSDYLLAGPVSGKTIQESTMSFFTARKAFFDAVSADVRRLASSREEFWVDRSTETE